ncbi:MAG: TetR family transcriptional regulator [Mycobacterium sp.]
MGNQSRSAATRQKIIDAGVELFAGKGYGTTSLNDITSAAHVTTGAFYYHFGSKEALAATIVADGWPKAWEVIGACIESPAPGLENVIVMTFALSELMKRDKSVWIANHLNQSLGLLNEDGRIAFERKARSFIEGVAGAINQTDIRPEVTPLELGNQVWMTVHGCHLLSDATGDSVSQRLEQSWRMLLRASVPVESLPYFEQFLARTAKHYRTD